MLSPPGADDELGQRVAERNWYAKAEGELVPVKVEDDEEEAKEEKTEAKHERGLNT